jgi:hypothetical protein
MSAEKTNKEPAKKKVCGIIMPISPHPDYPENQWNDVLGILKEAICETDFEPNLVSDDVAIGLIHDRIVTNIYNNEIVICDVSSKNPNVMFELGLRLAFDKPTIIIKDELTGYSFDTGVIEHITYPSSLRFSEIVKFKEELVRRINATYKKATTEKDFSPFLKSFGKTLRPTPFQQTEITEGKYILNQIELLRRDMQMTRFDQKRRESLFSVGREGIMRKDVFRKIRNKISHDKTLLVNDKLLLEEIRKQYEEYGVLLSEEFLKILLEEFQNELI